MTDYDAVVIGAGCGGMTAAVTLAQSGLRTLLLEKHNIPGGCATSFYRGRFEFETSLHQLSGMGTEDNPGQVRRILQKMGVLKHLEMVQEDTLYNIQINENLNIDLPSNKEALIDTLSKQFPEDKQQIEQFIQFIYDFMQEYKIIMFTDEQEVTQEKYPLFFKYVLRDMQSVFDEFISNEQIQICLGAYACYMGLTTKELPFERIASCLWSYIEFKPTHFVGGSQALSNALIDCFREAGGQVKFNCGVKAIVIDNDAAKAVITEDGETITTKQIISNASPIDTYTKMIGEQHIPESVMKEMNSREIGISAATVYLGLDCTAEDLGISEPCSFLFDKDADLDDMYGNPDKTPQACLLTCYSKVSPSFSPEGTCQLVLIDLQFGKPWLSISEKDYIDVKNRYASQMIDLAEKFYPGIRENIEVISDSCCRFEPWFRLVFLSCITCE